MAKINPELAKNIHENLVDHIMDHYERYYYLAYSLVKNAEGATKVVANAAYFSLYNGRKLKTLPPMHIWFLQLIVRDGMRTMNKRTYEREFTEDSQLYAFMETIEPSAVNVFKLYYFEGLNKEKTGEVLGLNDEEVQKRLSFVRAQLKIDGNLDEESSERLEEIRGVYESVEIPGNLRGEIQSAIWREEENYEDFLLKYKKDRVRKPLGLIILAAVFFFGTIILGRGNPIFAQMVTALPIINKIFVPFF